MEHELQNYSGNYPNQYKYYLQHKTDKAQKFKGRYYNDPEFREHIQKINRESCRKRRGRPDYISWAKRFPKKHALSSFKSGQKLKQAVLLHYSKSNSPVCNKCGIKDVDVLTIDHINNDGADHRRKIGVGKKVYLWLKQNNFPKGYQVLCMNCNWKKRMMGLKKKYGI